MRVDLEEARRIAELAHLEFDEPGIERMAREMTQILAYVDQLQQVDVEGVEITEEASTPLREDVPHAPLDRELIARNAPEWREGFFVVPQVIGGD